MVEDTLKKLNFSKSEYDHIWNLDEDYRVSIKLFNDDGLVSVNDIEKTSQLELYWEDILLETMDLEDLKYVDFDDIIYDNEVN